MEQQTAIEWLVNNIWKGEPTLHQKVLIEQAKQMETDQSDRDYNHGFSNGYNEGYDKGMSDYNKF